MTYDQDPSTPLTDEDRFHDIVDGRRIVKILNVYEIHLLNRLFLGIGEYHVFKRLGHAFFGLSYDLGLADGNRRMPDLSFVSRERWPMAKRLPSEGPWQVVPDLVADVITTGTSIARTRRKLGEYRQAGVRLIWLIIPGQERVTVFDQDSMRRLDSRVDCLEGHGVLPGFRMSLADLFDHF